MGLFIRLPVQYHITGKSGPVSRGDLWGVFFRHLPLWGAVAVSTWLVQHATSSLPPLAQLALGGLAGTAIGAIAIAGLPGLRAEVIFIFEQTRRFIHRRKETPA